MVFIAAPKAGGGSLCRARAQNLAAFAAASCKDRAAGPCGHPLTEAMRLGALPVIRLVRTLHVSPPYPPRR